jgi:hypothetical protein
MKLQHDLADTYSSIILQAEKRTAGTSAFITAVAVLYFI